MIAQRVSEYYEREWETANSSWKELQDIVVKFTGAMGHEEERSWR
jgi:hypothetical protein